MKIWYEIRVAWWLRKYYIKRLKQFICGLIGHKFEKINENCSQCKCGFYK